MKKALSIIFAMTITFTLSATPILAKTSNGKSNAVTEQKESKGNKSSNASTEESTVQVDSEESSTNNKQENKKEFRDELNEQKKELQQQKSLLNQQLEELQSQYELMLSAGDAEGAEAVLESINNLNEQIQGVQAQIKETINERYMLVKTMYTDDELAQFSSAAEVISQMYVDAEVLSEGSVTVNNNLIKFDTPAYIKGGVTLVPLRAIAEELDGEVSWDEETQTVIITKDGTTVQISSNSTTAIVNGETVEISLPATENCGRTYVPLRFLSEALGFNAEWDSENELIDISDVTEATDDEGIETSVEETVTTDEDLGTSNSETEI